MSNIPPVPIGITPQGAITQIPPGTPSQAWFIIPEGLVGQDVNAMSTEGDTFREFLQSNFRSSWDDLVEGFEQEYTAASGNTTSWTTIHVTNNPTQVLFLTNSGLTAYPTQKAAQTAAAADNRNVSPTGTSGLSSGLSLDLGPWVLRGGEIALGIMLIGVGVAKLTGAENAVSKLPKVIPL